MPTCSTARHVKPVSAGKRGSYWPQAEEQASRFVVAQEQQHQQAASLKAASSPSQLKHSSASSSNINSGKYVNRIKLISAPSNVSCTASNAASLVANLKSNLPPQTSSSSSSSSSNERPSTPALHHQQPDSRQGFKLKKRPRRLANAKLLLIALTGVDLLISVLVYQYAQEDQVNVWWWWWMGSLKQPTARLSLINLLLSGVWFIVFAAGLLYELKPLLSASVLLHLGSFVLLLVLSGIHLTRRIDYQLVHLSRLLLLLFLLALLHVYLLAMASLTLYLVLSLGRRRHQQQQQQQQQQQS